MANEQKQTPEPTPCEYPEFEQIHIIEYVNILLRRRWLIVAGVFIAVLLAGIYSKMLPPVYMASGKFLPARNPDMVNRMSALAGPGGRVDTIEENLTPDYYAELIRSGAFLERVARKKYKTRKFPTEVDLLTFYKIKGGNEGEIIGKAIKMIRASLSISMPRGTAVYQRGAQFVTVSYKAPDPELTASVVNGILNEAVSFNQTSRDSKALQNRQFIEKQLNETQDLLRKAETDLAEFSTRNRKIATPYVEVEADRLKRAVKAREEVHVTLARQLELAKIEEQQKKPFIEVIDTATVPFAKIGSSAKKNVVLAAFLSGFFFYGLAFVLEWMKKINPDEERNREFLSHIEGIKRDLRIFGKKKRK